VARVVRFARQACAALSEAHDAGVVHRDVKPDNLFVCRLGDEDDFLKMLDFGIAKIEGSEEASVTRAGWVHGTPSYMSPEACNGTGVDARSDIYSLGAVIYFLLTGVPPFQAPTGAAVMLAHVSEEPEPPSSRGVRVPADLERVVLRCLDKEPRARFQSARELDEALAACGDALATTGERVAAAGVAGMMRRSSRPLRASAAPVESRRTWRTRARAWRRRRRGCRRCRRRGAGGELNEPLLPSPARMIGMGGRSVRAHPRRGRTRPQATRVHPRRGRAQPQATRAHPRRGRAHPQATRAHPRRGRMHPQATRAHPRRGRMHPQATRAHPRGGGVRPEATRRHPARSRGAFGHVAHAPGSHADALGHVARAPGSHADALGHDADAPASLADALGLVAGAPRSYANAVGHVAHAPGASRPGRRSWGAVARARGVHPA